MTAYISKDTITRLLKDVKQMIKHPLTDHGIYYIHDDTDMLKGYALIIGPSETPYFSGNYFFEFSYPADYPHSPPLVKYYTNANNVRFNPNLYKCGKVCISILNTWRGDQWTSCQTISTVLLTLCTLLCKNPLLNEPGVTTNHPDCENYVNIIEYANIDIAICDIIKKKEGVYQKFFEAFYPYVKKEFLKNYDNILSFIQTKINKPIKPNKSTLVTTNIYSISINIDYVKLLTKLEECKEFLQLK